MKIATFAGLAAAGIMASALTLRLFVPAPGAEILPKVSHDGLSLVPRGKFAVAYVKPDTDFSRYKKFIVLEPEVTFSRDWRHNHRQLRAEDVGTMKKKFARAFRAALIRELGEEAGYPIVDQPAEGVLVLKPAVVDLEPLPTETRSPESAGKSVLPAGTAILYLEVQDSVSGEVLARALDRGPTSEGGRAFPEERAAGGLGVKQLLRDGARAQPRHAGGNAAQAPDRAASR